MIFSVYIRCLEDQYEGGREGLHGPMVVCVQSVQFVQHASLVYTCTQPDRVVRKRKASTTTTTTIRLTPPTPPATPCQNQLYTGFVNLTTPRRHIYYTIILCTISKEMHFLIYLAMI